MTGVDLMMEGQWELKINISAGGVEDTASFAFPDVKPPAIPAGRHHMQVDTGKASLSDLDYATSRNSTAGNFSLSYTPMSAKIPLNRIHSWNLNLSEMNGKPVNGARIRVRGDMPAHGHGLPTQPVITAETGPGQYRLEGMKFNMPGHWTVTFDLNIGNISDSVTFNLQVR